MALLKAFSKQLEKVKCPVCGLQLPRGKFNAHANLCDMNPEDDECKILKVISIADKKFAAIEQIIVADNNCEEEKPECSSTIMITKEDFYPIHMQAMASRKGKNHVECNDKEEISISDSRVDSKSTRKRPLRIDSAGSFVAKKFVESKSEESNQPNAKQRQHVKAVPVDHFRNFCFPYQIEKNEDLVVISAKISSILNTANIDLYRASPSKKHRESETKERMESQEADLDSIPPPYYLPLFLKILKKVFLSKSSQENFEFWNSNLYLAYNFLILSELAKMLFVKLYLRKRKWLSIEKLKYDFADLTRILDELEAANLIDSSNRHLNDLNEAIERLKATSLRSIAKLFKLDPNKNVNEIRLSLMKFSTQKNALGNVNALKMLDVVKKELGKCYRLNEDAWRFFTAVFTLYSPNDMNSALLIDQPSTNLQSQLLFKLLQLSLNKVRLPAPTDSQLLDIYSNSDKLYRYVIAKELEAKILDQMGKSNWADAIELSSRAYKNFNDNMIDVREYCVSLPAHLRRYTHAWVYVRCISYGVDAMQRIRNYESAAERLRELLISKEYSGFIMDHRGTWWNRLALNLDAHLKRKSEAFEVIKEGMCDETVSDKDRLLLQDRGEKLCNEWKGCLKLCNFTRIDIEGVILGKNLGDSRVNRFISVNDDSSCELSVEQTALSYYINQMGYEEGLHCEGTLWHTLFGLLCYHIIFDHNIENVWFSELQDHPSDLNTRQFYDHRKTDFDKRFAEIEQSSQIEINNHLTRNYESHYGETNSEISWDCFRDLNQLKRFVSCCKPNVLVAVFKRIVSDYRGCRSGFPDLVLWRASSQELAVVEVKGPGDKLSTKQRLWLDYFKNIGLIAHVAHVYARNSRRID